MIAKVISCRGAVRHVYRRHNVVELIELTATHAAEGRWAVKWPRWPLRSHIAAVGSSGWLTDEANRWVLLVAVFLTHAIVDRIA